MRPIKVLGPAYVSAGKLDVENRKVALALNLTGLILLFVFGWLFLQVFAVVRLETENASLSDVLLGVTVPLLLLTLVAVLVLHELIHGFFFWFFTREVPRFGFRLVYAYAAAPDWYIPRNQFIVTGSAPFLSLTIVGLILLPVIPAGLIPYFYLALTANAAGSVGDFLVAGWLIAKPASTLARDSGLRISLYERVQPDVAIMNERWLDLLDFYGIDQEAVRDAFRDLFNHYTGSDRHYHNLEHVGDVLDVIEELGELTQDLRQVQLAAWYHDIIYDTHFSDNEARSASYAKQALLKLGIPLATADRVSELVLATVSHEAAASDTDCQILLDADLSTLGAGEETFQRHSRALREEYGWVSDQEYQKSRGQFFSGLLERDRIYYIDQVYEAREKQARINLAGVVNSLP